jgi:hypothetical protein
LYLFRTSGRVYLVCGFRTSNYAAIDVRGVTPSDSYKANFVRSRLEYNSMRVSSTWRCPYCSKLCPRHWNMERHILSQHGLSGEPINSATGLTRVQRWARGSYGNRYFNGARKSQLQQGSWPSYYPYRNDTQKESDKGFWELADRVKDLKVLEIVRETKETW